MKTIKIKDFSFEISNDILDEFYKDMSNDDIVKLIVEEIQHEIGVWACFESFEVEDDQNM